MKCEYCQQNNALDALECRSCGAPLPVAATWNPYYREEDERGSPPPRPDSFYDYLYNRGYIDGTVRVRHPSL